MGCASATRKASDGDTHSLSHRSVLKNLRPSRFPWSGLRSWGRKRVMGKFLRKVTAPAQQDLWLRPEEIVTGPHHAFHLKLAALLKKLGSMEAVHRIFFPYFRRGSREGVHPSVEAFEGLHAEVLRPLREHGLVRGRSPRGKEFYAAIQRSTHDPIDSSCLGGRTYLNPLL